MIGKPKQTAQNHVFAKILSVVLACALWIYVVYEQNPVLSRTYVMELEKRGLPSNVALLNDLSRVRVIVSGPRRRMTEFAAKDMVAYIDLHGLERGVHDREVQVRIPTGLQLDEVMPPSVVVNADTFARRNFPVTVRFNDLLPPEFLAGVTSVEPNIVRVSGPAQLVENISAVETSFSVDQAMANRGEYKISAPLILLDKNNNISAKVAVEPGSVNLTVEVADRIISKDVPVRITFTGRLPSGYRLVNTKITPGNVNLQGSFANLNDITEILTEELSLDHLTRDLSLPVALHPPPGVTAGNNRVQVNLTIRESPR